MLSNITEKFWKRNSKNRDEGSKEKPISDFEHRFVVHIDGNLSLNLEDSDVRKKLKREMERIKELNLNVEN